MSRWDMTAYNARLQIEGETERPLPVVVDLTDDKLTMTIGEQEVAAWQREGMRIQALPDGFHIRAEGEAIVLDVTDDAEFALELGLRNAHPSLRRRMSALLRSD
jgi:hypothetical protein